MITSTPNTDLEMKHQELQQNLGHTFSKSELLVRALTHKSFDNENSSESPGHNEVLEFLGDAVLDLGLGHLLMVQFAKDDEGGLSKKRASLVNEAVLSQIALELKLDELIKLGRGEKSSGGSRKPRLLASTFEALVGSIYLDAGFEAAQSMIRRMFEPRIVSQDWTADFANDYKTRLQEKIQSDFGVTPHYVVLSQTGPDHDKRFEVEVKMGDRHLANGSGSSKKSAEQDAARLAIQTYSKE